MIKQPRILLVEDDPDEQEVVSTILLHINILTDVADNAEQAQAVLSDSPERFDAIVIDLALPGKDGWALLADIQNNPKTAQIPCIAVTAYHTSQLRTEALKAGFKYYFAKPINTTTFSGALQLLV